MAHVWSKNDEGGWTAVPLELETYRLSGSGISAEDRAASRGGDAVAALRRCGSDDSTKWVLLLEPGAAVHVNGMPLRTGIRVLRDRDEILVALDGSGGGRRYFFSTEQLARVEPLPSGAAEFCARCKDRFQPGVPAVRCPRCRLWHHQTEEKPCWTYAELCAGCYNQPTALGSSYTWSPEQL